MLIFSNHLIRNLYVRVVIMSLTCNRSALLHSSDPIKCDDIMFQLLYHDTSQKFKHAHKVHGECHTSGTCDSWVPHIERVSLKGKVIHWRPSRSCTFGI